MEYEKRVIIYLDMLGFADFIHLTARAEYGRRERIADIHKLFKELRSILYTDEESIHLTKSKIITNFSDLIVISFLANELEYTAHELYEVQVFIANCVLKGHFMRGCIIYGDLVHNRDMIFGPGLVEAYEIERSKAKFPRVIVDSAIVNDQKLYSNDRSKDFRNEELEGIVTIDEDGEYYIDFFSKTRPIVDNFSQYIKYVKQMTILLIGIIDNPVLRPKVEWIMPKYNMMASEMQKALFSDHHSFDIETKKDLILMMEVFDEVDIKSYEDKL